MPPPFGQGSVSAFRTACHGHGSVSELTVGSVVVGVRIFILVVVFLFATESFLFVVLVIKTIAFVLFFLL